MNAPALARRWREAVAADDVAAVRGLVAATGFFSAEEQDIAAELVQERLDRGAASGYEFILAESGSRLDGYACYGRIAGTLGSFDLYWIAVHPELQGRGLGLEIVRRAELAMMRQGARAIYIETSGRDQYRPTRGFYLRAGYREAAVLPEFYGPGDSKVIFSKHIPAPAGQAAL
jgi:ribosomal protein S18 acetylase RimI-like enzyme